MGDIKIKYKLYQLIIFIIIRYSSLLCVYHYQCYFYLYLVLFLGSIVSVFFGFFLVFVILYFALYMIYDT